LTYSPWADVAERHPGVHVHRCAIAPVNGAWVASERIILLSDELDMAGRRCTLAHEIAHIDLRHAAQSGWFGTRSERDADRLAAARLLEDVDEIADALCVHPLHPELAAEHLGVTVRVLRRRLANLTATEKEHVEQRLAAREDGA